MSDQTASTIQPSTITSSLSEASNELIGQQLPTYFCAPRGEAYIVNGFNVNNGFYNFQLAVQNMITSKLLLTFESNIAHILAVSTIMLLCQQTNDAELDRHLNGFSSAIIKDLKFNSSLKAAKSPRGIVDNLLDIHYDMTMDTCTTELLSTEYRIFPLNSIL